MGVASVIETIICIWYPQRAAVIHGPRVASPYDAIWRINESRVSTYSRKCPIIVGPSGRTAKSYRRRARWSGEDDSAWYEEGKIRVRNLTLRYGIGRTRRRLYFCSRRRRSAQ